MRRFRRRVGDIVTPFVEAGPHGTRDGDEAAVVFVHGNPGSSEEWVELVHRVGEHRRAIAFDMPGFGRADKPHPGEPVFDYTVEGYARHLGDVADTLGLTRFHLVVHDFGGPWGLQFAAEYPERIASLVLVNALGMPDYRWHAMARIWRRPAVGELAMRAANRRSFGLALRLGNPVPIPRSQIETMYANFDAATRRSILALYRSTDESDLDRLAERLKGQRLPAMVIWGETDPYISLTDAQRFRRIFPDTRFVRIPGHGHWPHLTAPGSVEDAVLLWLRTRVSA